MEEKGYSALLLCLLIQAIDDYCRANRKEQKDAEAWLFQDIDAPIKFSDVCYWHDLDEDCWRRLIRNRKLAKKVMLSLRKSKWLFGNREPNTPVLMKWK